MPQTSSTRSIILSQGFKALVDAEDFDWLNQYSWFVWIPQTQKGRIVYAVRKGLIGEGRAGNTKILMHREIMHAAPEVEVDHKDNTGKITGLDNRKTNLRIVTTAQNQWNARKHRDATTSRFKGVVFSRGKWQAQIQHAKRRRYLGRFDTEIGAAQAYNEAAVSLFGNFANLNII